MQYSIIENNYSSLFERIRQKCRQRHCYGSDVDYVNMNQFAMWSEDSEDKCWYDSDGNEHKVGRRERIQRYQEREQRYALLRTSFAYPPATEAQLYTTEEALGFSLPVPLRALYSQVANGGFGPSYGIIGAQGGFPARGEDEGEDIADVYHRRNGDVQLVDLVLYEEELVVKKELRLPWKMFPARLLLLCDDGCGMKTFIDANTGRIFQESIYSEQYRSISLKADSLKEWLETWLITQ